MKDDVRNLAQFTVMTENNFLKKISPWIWKKNVFWCSFNVDIFKCQLFDLLYIFYSLLWGMKTMEISITTHEIIWWKTLRSEATVNQFLKFLLFVCLMCGLPEWRKLGNITGKGNPTIRSFDLSLGFVIPSRWLTWEQSTYSQL